MRPNGVGRPSLSPARGERSPHVYSVSPSAETVDRAVASLRHEAHWWAHIHDDVETVAAALNRSMPAKQKVVWEGERRSGRYRVVGRSDASEETPIFFHLERGHVDHLGNWSWNNCGSQISPSVFQQIMADYVCLAGGEGGGS